MTQEDQIASLDFVPAWSPVTARGYNYGDRAAIMGISAYERMKSQELMAHEMIYTFEDTVLTGTPRWMQSPRSSIVLPEESAYNGEDYN